MTDGGAKKTVAIYGGSFNPPHICHQIAVLYALESAACDEVWLVPVYRHAFGKESAPYDVRRELCMSLIEIFPKRARVCDVEKELGGTSRTVDTLEELKRRYPEIDFKLLMGSDIRSEAHKWKRFDRICELAEIIWIGRAGQSQEASDTIVLPDISSSEIRKRIKDGRSLEGLIPARVLAKWHELGRPAFG